MLTWTQQLGYPNVTSRSAAASPTTGTVVANTGGINLYRSIDGGVTWNSLTFAQTLSGDIVSDGSVFLTSDSIGNVYRSIDDGQTWSAIAISGMPVTSNPMTLAADGAGNWVALSCAFSGGAIFHSVSNDGGATWSTATAIAGTHHAIQNCTLWDGTQFVGNGWDSSFNWILVTSPDGVTWTTHIVESIFTNQPICFDYDGVEYIAGLNNGVGGNAAIRRGTSLVNFIAAADTGVPAFGNNVMNAIAHAGSALWVAADQNIGTPGPTSAESADGGVTWTLDSPSPSLATGVYFVRIIYNAVSGGFLAFGTGTQTFLYTSPFSIGIPVPNVVGQPLATGEANIVSAGLTVGVVTTASSGSVPSGDIISTNPVAGTLVSPGSPVDIVESTGPAPVVVPDVTGLSLAAATAAITGATLVVGTVTSTSSPTVPSGDIITQNPVGGTVVLTGAAVDLTESTGPATGTVPNVVGLSRTTAESTLLAAGFFVGVETGAYSTTVPMNLVISQSPVGGSTEVLGTAVNFTYSLGIPPVAVPDVIGDTLIVGENAIISASLVVGPISAQVSPGTPIGTILGQSPAPGTLVPPGTVVSITSVSAFANAFPVTQTVISQYANSPTLLRLVDNMAQYLDQSVNFVNFFQFVWNVDTAVGFGLDIWGKIVGVSRLLHIGANQDTFGFENSDRPYDWQNFGGGTFFNGGSGTAYLLPDDAYRILILTKALANITATTSKALNQLLRNLFPGRGVCFVRDNLDMTMTFVFKFPLTPIEFAILTQSGALPHPAGVGFNVLVVPPDRFGFQEAGPAALPFNFGVFYLPS